MERLIPEEALGFILDFGFSRLYYAGDTALTLSRPLHHGDPQEIIEHMGESAPDCRLMLLCQGESFLLKK